MIKLIYSDLIIKVITMSSIAERLARVEERVNYINHIVTEIRIKQEELFDKVIDVEKTLVERQSRDITIIKVISFISVILSSVLAILSLLKP